MICYVDQKEKLKLFIDKNQQTSTHTDEMVKERSTGHCAL